MKMTEDGVLVDTSVEPEQAAHRKNCGNGWTACVRYQTYYQFLVQPFAAGIILYPLEYADGFLHKPCEFSKLTVLEHNRKAFYCSRQPHAKISHCVFMPEDIP